MLLMSLGRKNVNARQQTTYTGVQYASVSRQVRTYVRVPDRTYDTNIILISFGASILVVYTGKAVLLILRSSIPGSSLLV